MYTLYKWYTKVIKSRCFALSSFVLFFSLMQSVNDTIFLVYFFMYSSCCCIYSSSSNFYSSSQKYICIAAITDLTFGLYSMYIIFYFNEVLCSKFWWLVSCTVERRFSDTHFCLCINIYNNQSLSIICCCFPDYMYFSFLISLINFSFICVDTINLFAAFCKSVLIILSAILLQIKSSVVAVVFWIALFEAVLSAPGTDFFFFSF